MRSRLKPALALCALICLGLGSATAWAADTAGASGIAVGRDVNNSTLNVYNSDPAALQLLAQRIERSEADRQAAEAKAAELARRLGLTGCGKTAHKFNGRVMVGIKESRVSVG